MNGLIAFVWLVSIVISAVIGNKKGNPLGGLVLGLLFGPLGAVVVLLSEDKNRVACPYCAEKIQKAAKICPHCRKELRPLENSSDKSVSPVENATPISDAQQMQSLGIIFDGTRYVFKEYKYDKLADAISYAKKQSGLA